MSSLTLNKKIISIIVALVIALSSSGFYNATQSSQIGNQGSIITSQSSQIQNLTAQIADFHLPVPKQNPVPYSYLINTSIVSGTQEYSAYNATGCVFGYCGALNANAGGATGTSLSSVVGSLPSGGIDAFSSGTFTFKAYTNLPESIISGQGQSSKLAFSGFTAGANALGVSSNTTISDFLIDDNGQSGAVLNTIFVYAASSSNVVFQNLYFQHVNSKDIIASAATSKATIVSSVIMKDIVSTGGQINYQYTKTLTLSGLVLSSPPTSNPLIGGNHANQTSMSNLILNVNGVSGGYCEDLGYQQDIIETDIRCSGGSVYMEGSTQNVTITNSRLTNGAQFDVVGTAGLSPSRLVFVSDTIDGAPTTGAFVFTGTAFSTCPRDITISGSLVSNSLGTGVEMNCALNSLIEGTQILNSSQAATNTYSGIVLDGQTSNTTIIGDTIRDVGSIRSEYAIQELSTNGYTSISGNLFAGQTTGFIIYAAATQNQVGLNAFSPVASITTVNAGTSVWTYTNKDAYPETLFLTTAAGISTWSCNGMSGWPTSASPTGCHLGVGQAMMVTWSTTTPTFTKVPDQTYEQG